MWLDVEGAEVDVANIWWDESEVKVEDGASRGGTSEMEAVEVSKARDEARERSATPTLEHKAEFDWSMREKKLEASVASNPEQTKFESGEVGGQGGESFGREAAQH